MTQRDRRSSVSDLEISRHIAGDNVIARLADLRGAHFLSHSLRRLPQAIGGRRRDRDDQDEIVQHEDAADE